MAGTNFGNVHDEKQRVLLGLHILFKTTVSIGGVVSSGQPNEYEKASDCLKNTYQKIEETGMASTNILRR
ncbi:MAG: hypothetical protein WAL30_06940 [Candidatus Aquirickettsiella sp.]